MQLNCLIATISYIQEGLVKKKENKGDKNRTLLISRERRKRKERAISSDGVGEGVGGGQGLGGVTSHGTDQVVKGRRVRDTGSEVLQVPEVAEGLEDRGGRVRRRLAGGGVGAVLLNVALGRVGGDQPGGHTATEAVELEGVLVAVGGGLGVGLVVGADGQRGGDVVGETTSLIVGDQEEGLLPLRTGADSVVDLLDEDLAVRDVAGGVHGVGVGAAAGRVDVGELGQLTQVGVLEEVLDGDNGVLGLLGGPVEEHGIGQEGTVGTVVVAPGDAVLGGNLENAGDLDGRGVEGDVVVAVAVGSTSNGTETVGVGRLLQLLDCDSS